MEGPWASALVHLTKYWEAFWPCCLVFKATILLQTLCDCYITVGYQPLCCCIAKTLSFSSYIYVTFLYNSSSFIMIHPIRAIHRKWHITNEKWHVECVQKWASEILYVGCQWMEMHWHYSYMKFLKVTWSSFNCIDMVRSDSVYHIAPLQWFVALDVLHW